MQTRSTFVTHSGRKPKISAFKRIFQVLYLGIARKYFNKFPELPWIPFSAIAEFNTIIKKDWKILEIGAGMSTIWLAKKSGYVTSIEADLNWYNKLGEIIKEKKIENIDLRYEWERDIMCDFSEFPDGHFDLIYIDGGPRDLCCMNAKSKVKKGGYIYLDNSDNESLSSKGADILLDFVDHDENCYKIFVDFVPGNLMINEGLLIQI
ncbi:MAG: class I SAM-dependent methyltransferase [Pedobacter sp.]|nr:MAG: class I SAM-dependent methyltransferase [Pedobacter sp.]